MQDPSDGHAASYLAYPVTHVAHSLYRRLTESVPPTTSSSLARHSILPGPEIAPLTPLSLLGASDSSVLSRVIAEEVRLLVPPRVQLVDRWSLVYSLASDGVSLATLYQKCANAQLASGAHSRLASFVLAVQDASGTIFGAYLTEAPQPRSSYYGTGECFLWRASSAPSNSLLANLPPPPSSPTSPVGRCTTISPASSRQTMRFKAFPYSGVNDYLILCEPSFLSVGGGDGKYGLWLDAVLEKGISGPCPTFGNEPLSDEGDKFDVVAVEVWSIS